MSNKVNSEEGIDALLSPKQIQDRRRRSLTISKIDQQINNIMNLNTKQHVQYQDFVQKLVGMEAMYEKQNKGLKEAYLNLLRNYENIEQMYLITKQELQQNIISLEEKEKQNSALKKQIVKLKFMVQNQQSLMEEYRTNLEEQIALQKELMNSLVDEEKAKLQRQFSHALAQIERQYTEKLKKATVNNKIKEYKLQMDQFKKYFKTNKQNMNSKPGKTCDVLTDKQIISEYSTSTQQTRHNTAIYIP